jgi:hypothetical protein
LALLYSQAAARSLDSAADLPSAGKGTTVAVAAAAAPRSTPLQIALRYVGLEERPGNRGVMIDRWNRFVHNPLGSPYCAAFVSWCLEESHARAPTVRTGWARGFILPTSYTMNDVLWGRYTPQPGDIIPFTRPGGGHVGFVTRYFGKGKFELVEANTSPGSSGSQHNGGGVYRRTRTYQPHASFRMMGVTPVLE